MIHGTLGETPKQTDYTLDSFKGPVKALRRDQFCLGAEAPQGQKKKSFLEEKTFFGVSLPRLSHVAGCENNGDCYKVKIGDVRAGASARLCGCHSDQDPALQHRIPARGTSSS